MSNKPEIFQNNYAVYLYIFAINILIIMHKITHFLMNENRCIIYMHTIFVIMHFGYKRYRCSNSNILEKYLKLFYLKIFYGKYKTSYTGVLLFLN